jgi:hypothetical protein
MSLGKFEEDNLLEFREKALLRYSVNGEDSESYNLGNWARAANRWLQNNVNLNNLRTNSPGNSGVRRVPSPVPGRRTNLVYPAGSSSPASSSSGNGSSRSSTPSGRSSTPSGRSSTPSGRSSTSSGGRGNQPRQQQQPTETAAQREARLQREREEAERRERERREAEERLRQQREATEAARRERLRSITRDVAQRIIENALVNANKGQSDADSQLCQRPDGSIYGIAIGQNCVSGKPIDKRPEPDRTEQINEAARNDPNQQNLPVGWRTTRPDTPAPSEAGGSGSSSRTPEEARRRARERSQAQGRERALQMGREYQRSPRGTATPPPAPAPVPAEPRPASADSRISGNTNEASA